LRGDGGNDVLIGARGNDLLFGEGGNDQLFGRLGNDALLGGAGNDIIKGEAGHDLILGEAGNDKLYGLAGRDILIGGIGKDLLDGGADDDLLIGGTTDFDGNAGALAAISAEWNSAASVTVRKNNLNGSTPGGLNDPFFLDATTVHSDGARDTLISGAGFDWFLRSTADNDLAVDRVAAKDQLVNL
jgi:Ca2+-binding RTX toxin-like protein